MPFRTMDVDTARPNECVTRMKLALDRCEGAYQRGYIDAQQDGPLSTVRFAMEDDRRGRWLNPMAELIRPERSLPADTLRAAEPRWPT